MDYLVPANAKKSTLILGFLRPMPDLLILSIGVCITAIWLLSIDTSDMVATIIAVIPALIATVLIMPIPYYHNTLVAIGCVIKFFSGRRIYYWKGWCYSDEFKD